MKQKLTLREKVLMIILALLVIFCAYNFLFKVPVADKVTLLETEIANQEEQIALANTKMEKMNQMKHELSKIEESGNMAALKEIPAFDNSKNVMNSLSSILKNASQYNVNFSSVTEEGSMVKRVIALNFSCPNFETAKSILTQIAEGEYRCLLSNLSISISGNSCSVSVNVTYFESK